MAGFVLRDCRLFAGPVDLTSVNNQVMLSCELEQRPTTAFGDAGWRTLLGGLFSTGIDAAGQWEAGVDAAAAVMPVDPASWDGLVGRQAHPWTACPESADVGSLAWFTAAQRSSYKLGGEVGQVAPWEAKAASSGPLLRGVVVHAPGVPRSTAGAGPGSNRGPLSASQRLYAAVHVLSVTGTASPSITVRVESDSDNTFATPTTRATFSAASAAAGRGQLVQVAGPVTDTWWRVAWTVTGTAPEFLFLAAFGVA
ncbi:hypothetical protein [Nonomuraea sp. NPDC050786]|uniref:hypothetical protein n=1 Tax=Nonomuraea sp. NPDC050786 TaxID=3154840 RepID=UPI0034046DCA